MVLREEIITTEEQHDLDKVGIAKNAREEKLRARTARIKHDEENARMARLYRQHVLKEQPAPELVTLDAIKPARRRAGRSRLFRRLRIQNRISRARSHKRSTSAALCLSRTCPQVADVFWRQSFAKDLPTVS